jgi:hypothetical protein
MQFEGRVNIQTERGRIRATLSARATRNGPATAPSPVGVAKALLDAILTTPKTPDPGIALASVFDASSWDT